ncbi:MAG: hypothetical protein ABF619_06725 [Oenococcus oeni]
MKKSYDISELGDFANDLEKKITAFHGKHLNEKQLFPDSWVAKYTKFKNWNEFASNAPWEGAFTDDSKKSEREKFVSENSSFKSWQDMLNKASSDYVTRQISN